MRTNEITEEVRPSPVSTSTRKTWSSTRWVRCLQEKESQRLAETYGQTINWIQIFHRLGLNHLIISLHIESQVKVTQVEPILTERVISQLIRRCNRPVDIPVGIKDLRCKRIVGRSCVVEAWIEVLVLE